MKTLGNRWLGCGIALCFGLTACGGTTKSGTNGQGATGNEEDPGDPVTEEADAGPADPEPLPRKPHPSPEPEPQPEPIPEPAPNPVLPDPEPGTDGGMEDLICGNGAVEVGEACDGADLEAQTCATVTMGARLGGTLRCAAGCAFDLTGCVSPPPQPLPPELYTCFASQPMAKLLAPPATPPAGAALPADPNRPVLALPTCGSFQGGPAIGVCAPKEIVAEQMMLPQDICPEGMLCVPAKKFPNGGCNAPCNAPNGFGPGACVPSYLAPSAELLQSGDCAEGEACVPCVNPIDETTTGACAW